MKPFCRSTEAAIYFADHVPPALSIRPLNFHTSIVSSAQHLSPPVHVYQIWHLQFEVDVDKGAISAAQMTRKRGKCVSAWHYNFEKQWPYLEM